MNDAVFGFSNGFQSAAAYHYTSLFAAVEMLRNSEIWLTSIRSMNDAGEWHYALRETVKLLHDRGHKEVAEYLKRTVGYVFQQKNLHVDSMEAQYVLCLSQTSNDVSQWRLYADGANGVCLEFDVGQLCRNDLSLRAFEVSYGIESVSEGILRYANAQRHDSREDQQIFAEEQLADINHMFDARGLLYQTAFLKHHSFRSEQEVRVVFSRGVGAYTDEDGDTFIDPDQSSLAVAAGFRVRNGDLVPYVKRSFSPLCVRRIICCGRSANPDNAGALRHFLLSRPDCSHIEVAVEPSLFR